MTVTTLELPQAVSLEEGESVDLELRVVADQGKLVVQRMHVHLVQAPAQSAAERTEAVERFLKNWSGSLGNLSDKAVDDIRWEAIKEKHLR